jgi:hypothetical protein
MAAVARFWLRDSPMLRFLIFACYAIPAVTATDASTLRSPIGTASIRFAEQWQGVELQSTPRAASQVTILIQTDGPRMIGLIWIPGARASNFDTVTGGRPDQRPRQGRWLR